MNSMLLKERRSLRGSFLATVAATILCALIFNGGDAEGVVILAYAVGAVLMAASIFGNEFHSQTMLLLLSQPAPRRQLWSDKMRELALELFVSFVVLILSLAFLVHGEGRIGAHSNLVALALIVALCVIPLVAFCSAPLISLHVKNVLGAMAFTFVLPYVIMFLFLAIDWSLSWLAGHTNLFLELLSIYHPVVFWFLVGIAALAYCFAFYQMGYRAFLDFQVVDSQSPEVSLPPVAEQWLARLTPGYTGPFASLVRKELRLQQVSFIVAGFSAILAPILALAWKIHPSEIMTGILALPLFLCVFCIPVLTGLVTLAEERNMGVIGWQLTQPVSARKQWFAKMLVSFGTCVALGVVLPAVMLFLGHELFGFWKDAKLIDSDEFLMWSLVYIAFFSLVVFASTISTNATRAVASAFGVLIACAAVVALGIYAFGSVTEYYSKNYSSNSGEGQWYTNVILMGIASLLLICGIILVNRFSYNNFRTAELPNRRIWTQLVIIMLYAGIVPLVMGLTIYLFNF